MDAAGFIKERVGLFKDFPSERIKELVDGSRVRSFEANEAIAHQGEEATHFGVVLSGTVAASARRRTATRQSLGQLKAGDTFGEMALMTGDPLLADFIAESRCEVLLIPVSLFQSVIVAEPGAVQHISRTIAERMKTVLADPAKAAAALRQGNDPYGLKLKGERPEKILVINCGSSSLKYSFYDTADESRQARGQVERIGIDGTRLAASRAEGRSEARVAERRFRRGVQGDGGGTHRQGNGSHRRRGRSQRRRASRRAWRRKIHGRQRSSPTRCWRRSRRSIRSRRCTIR